MLHIVLVYCSINQVVLPNTCQKYDNCAKMCNLIFIFIYIYELNDSGLKQSLPWDP